MAAPMLVPGLLLFAVIFTFAASHSLRIPMTTETKNEKLFEEFIVKYGKSYRPGSDEYKRRFNIFQDNLVRQAKLNATANSNGSAYYGVTQFSDLTPEEFKAKYLNINGGPPIQTAIVYSSKSSNVLRFKPSVIDYKKLNIPQKWDWREKKVVTPVKNQLHCGACWAFSSVENIETMHAIKTGTLSDLSTQQMIDCAGNGNYGCSGGDICMALSWLQTTKMKLVTENKYPLTNKSNYCKMFPTGYTGIPINSSTCHTFVNQEDEMLRLIAEHGPLTISVDAVTWNDYLGGIIQYHCSTFNNHAVVIVGYDLTGDIPYYIVRNSWGNAFGINGYLHIKVGMNVCGVAVRVATVTV
ncbi:cathepsin O-like [Tubulanus polymorphus]|uniref:cathepsin O-like n=1 Tax=Tubulanus polymorphus TaxID=672921 RepID=UPI003DA2FD56